MTTSAGPVPVISHAWSWKDQLGAAGARLGVIRDNYRFSPGLYALGNPNELSQVIVTCNYKLTFDILRRELQGRSIWILVVETYGINVWCAAGKKSFSTDEVIRQVKQSGLNKIVTHRTLILPQLSAPSVAAHKLKKLCRFKGVFGPIRANDLPEFLDNGMHTESQMRGLNFPLSERMEVAIVEVYGARKLMFWAFLACFALAALGPGGFTLQGIFKSGLGACMIVLSGFVSGTFIVPALLPWIKFRAFAAKGLVTGIAIGILVSLFLAGSGPEFFASVTGVAGISSWFAMHYTGSTPFTSLSGVDREMRIYMPVQMAIACLAILIWVGRAWFEMVVG
ncbi:MAG: carbon monoxide dehydrogenase [Desulfonatronovibrio sp. MSAO_Bac4]|nr:MAG: carbon monoxide dehydrogenase [Desulfonatronovibrio sp. MSAO_Bac4]